MAERMAIPEEQLIVLPRGISWDTAAFFEPASCVMHGMRRMKQHAAFPKQGRALVVGAGPIGLLWILALRAADFTVDAVEPAPFRSAFADRVGARTVYEPEYLTTLAALREPVEEKGYDVLVDASGNLAAPAAMVRLARNGAFVNLFGQQKAGHTVDAFPVVEANQKELTIVGSYATNNESPETAEFLQENLPFSELITHRLFLENGHEGFTAMENGTSMKVLILPNEEGEEWT
jgi:threonine dehydrogenase-like Zn-dependent dehydrogenase